VQTLCIASISFFVVGVSLHGLFAFKICCLCPGVILLFVLRSSSMNSSAKQLTPYKPKNQYLVQAPFDRLRVTLVFITDFSAMNEMRLFDQNGNRRHYLKRNGNYFLNHTKTTLSILS